MNAKDVCRTCLHSGGAMHPIIDSNATLPLDSPVFTFIEMLQFFTDIRIPYQDGCPIQLCTDCRDDVHRIYTFILKCRRADAILKQLKDVKIRLTKLRDDDQEKSDSDATENILSNIALLQNERGASRKIKEEPYSDSTEQLDAVPGYDESLLRLLRHHDTLGNAHEIFVDGHLVKVKEEPELDIEDEQFDQAYSEYPTRTEIGNNDPGPDVDLDMMESLFQSSVIGNQSEEENILWSINSNDYEKITQRSSTADYRMACATYTCTECFETYRSERKYDEHMKIHSEKNECMPHSKQHRNKHDLKGHVIGVHGSKAKNRQHKCDICGKLYARKAHWARHVEGHANDKSFKCEFCTKYFRFKTTLTFHKRSKHLHELLSSKNNCVWIKNDCKTDDRPFTCEICFKNFPTKMRREQHRKTHTPLRPFKCEICDKDFRTKHHLKCHDIRKHPLDSAITGLQCDECSRFFACKSDLERHLHTHTGEKPFKCDICKDEYRYKRYLINHMQEKHGVF